MTRDELEAAVAAEAQAFVRRVVELAMAAEAAKPVEPGPVVAPAPRGPCIDADGLKAFFNAARNVPPLGPGLDAAEVRGCEQVLLAASAARWPLSWAAYGLATAYHETAGTMEPLKEYGRGKGKPYGVPGRNKGQVPYGRGFVQLTWDDNYEAMDKVLGLGGKLIANYDLALEAELAARIMVVGMEGGLFNSKRKGLAAYLPDGEADIHEFSNARRTVNILDRAVDIAEYALDFQGFLKPVWKC